MQVFDIYEHPTWGLRAVKRGFSWSAFLAPSVWAAAKGLGTLTLLLVVCSTLMFDLLKIATDFVSHPGAMLALFIAAYLCFGLKPGIRGNAWHAEKLESDGFDRKFTVAAESRNHALRAVRTGHVRHAPDLLLANGLTA
jgi:hypothetical protein